MPELPEVETIKRFLQKNLIGKKILVIKILVHKQFHGMSEKAINTSIKQVERKGKVIYLELSNKQFLSFHLKMTGQILFRSINSPNANNLPNRHTRIFIEFKDGASLFFNDLRMFGWVKLTDKPEVPKGPDVLNHEFTETYLKQITNSTNKLIKPFLLDQDKLAGIGNIYANDSLWEAHINPQRKCKTLKAVEIKNLYKAINKIITEAIKYKGSSAKDKMYVLPDGTRGGYQNRFRVYERSGLPCLRDKTIIRTIKIGGRGTFYCPKCQI